MFTGVDEGVFIQHNERELIASTCKAHQQCIFTTGLYSVSPSTTRCWVLNNDCQRMFQLCKLTFPYCGN